MELALWCYQGYGKKVVTLVPYKYNKSAGRDTGHFGVDIFHKRVMQIAGVECMGK